MARKDIQIGLPCEPEALCFWAGLLFGLFIAILLGAFVLGIVKQWWKSRK